MSDDIFDYKENVWEKKCLAKELLMSNYNYELISTEESFGMYTFPLFSKEFCKEMVSKLKKFDNWTKDRHELYPTNDVLIDDFDKRFSEIYNATLYNIVRHAINSLYDADINDSFTHETFIIRYNPEIQGHLDLHHDHSSFTVCITFSGEDEYEGGGTWFPKHKKLLKAGRGVVTIHPGIMTHKHGVRPITKGERYSMVSFCKLKFNE